MKAHPFKSLAVASAAAALPMSAGTANAVESSPKADPTLAFAAAAWVPKWHFSAEGGALISDYSRTSFPGGLEPAFGKMGDFTDRSGSLSPGQNHGWFGALSIGRDIDPIWDWRLTGSFNSFNSNSRSASVTSGDFEGVFDSSRMVTESDRFQYGTIDFDMGRKWMQGMLQTRTFAGVRFLGAEQRLNISDSEAKGFFATDGESLFLMPAAMAPRRPGRVRTCGPLVPAWALKASTVPLSASPVRPRRPSLSDGARLTSSRPGRVRAPRGLRSRLLWSLHGTLFLLGRRQPIEIRRRRQSGWVARCCLAPDANGQLRSGIQAGMALERRRVLRFRQQQSA
jgi:hypothetical protein